MARARSGEGPSLIEAVTYRLGDHTTADDASRYRDDVDVSAHWKEEPIARLRAYLVDQKAWSKKDEEALLAECASQINQATEDYLATPAEPPQAMFDYLFARLPTALVPQVEAVKQAEGQDHG